MDAASHLVGNDAEQRAAGPKLHVQSVGAGVLPAQDAAPHERHVSLGDCQVDFHLQYGLSRGGLWQAFLECAPRRLQRAEAESALPPAGAPTR